MIRLLIKLALLVAVIAFFMPREKGDGDAAGPALSPVVLFYGATQAISDLGSFCDRSPAACATGREAAAYAGARIMEGVQVLVAMATGRPDPVPVAPRHREPAAAAPAETVSLRPVSPAERTGSIAPGPRPYMPPVLQAVPAAPQAETPARHLAPAAPRRDAAPAPSRAPVAARQPVSTATAVRPPARAASRDVAAALPTRPPGVPGAEKPFRMPAMAGGAEPAVSPRPFALVPPPAPARPPLPVSAPRA